MSRLKRVKKSKKEKLHALPPQFLQVLQQAMNLQNQSNFVEASALYAQLNTIHPEHDTVLINAGICFYHMRQYDRSLSYLKQVSPHSEHQTICLKMTGLCYTRKENFVAAESFLSKAYAQDRSDYEVVNWFLYALNQNAKPKQAIELFKSLNHSMVTPDTAADYIDSLIMLDRKPDAVTFLNDLIKDQPDQIKYYTLLGKAYFETREMEKSVAAYKHVYDAHPQDMNAASNYALGLTYCYKFDEALEIYNKVMPEHRHDHRLYTNMSNVYRMKQEMDQAIECAEIATRIAPWNPSVRYAYGMHNMVAERYNQGWVNTEYFGQINKHKMYKPQVQAINWYGQNLSQKRITVYADQGVGDTILFSRYIPMFFDRYPDCNVSVIAEKKLHPLMESMMDDLIVQLVDKNAQLPANFKTDYVIAASSLPYVFGTTIDDVPPPYETIPYDRSLNYKTSDQDFVIGISWRTSSSDAGYKRSIDLKKFKFLSQFPNVKIVDLQYGDTSEERAACGFDIIHDDTVDCWVSLQDHVDQIHACDLVISVDNTTVHAAGAIGKPVWTILPYDCFWRCWHLGHESTPWYPSMRLFRQDDQRDYDGVLQSIAKKLKSILDGKTNFSETLVFEPKYQELPPDQKVVIINDHFAGASWGQRQRYDKLTAVIKADHVNSAVTTIDHMQISRAPVRVPTLKDFDDAYYLSEYRFSDPSLFDHIEKSDSVYIDAGFDLNGLNDTAIRLLYLIYVAKTVFRKQVNVSISVCLPEGNSGLTDPNIVAFYRKALLVTDHITVENSLSHNLLTQLQIPCQHQPAKGDEVGTSSKTGAVVVAGMQDMSAELAQAVNKAVADELTDEENAIILTGGPYFNRDGFQKAWAQTATFMNIPMDIEISDDLAAWRHTIAQARLCLTSDLATAQQAVGHQIPTVLFGRIDGVESALCRDYSIMSFVDVSSGNLVAETVIAVNKLKKNY